MLNSVIARTTDKFQTGQGLTRWFPGLAYSELGDPHE